MKFNKTKEKNFVRSEVIKNWADGKLRSFWIFISSESTNCSHSIQFCSRQFDTVEKLYGRNLSDWIERAEKTWDFFSLFFSLISSTGKYWKCTFLLESYCLAEEIKLLKKYKNDSHKMDAMKTKPITTFLSKSYLRCLLINSYFQYWLWVLVS